MRLARIFGRSKLAQMSRSDPLHPEIPWSAAPWIMPTLEYEEQGGSMHMSPEGAGPVRLAEQLHNRSVRGQEAGAYEAYAATAAGTPYDRYTYD